MLLDRNGENQSKEEFETVVKQFCAFTHMSDEFEESVLLQY